MIVERVGEYRKRVHDELKRAFADDHTPREVAGSFAVGVFITMLPTLGTGLLLFVVLVALFKSISKIALFASVLVFNPVVKWGVYAASFTLGTLLLGPVEGVTMADVSLSAGPEIVVRLLVGNLVLAVLATVLGYVVVFRLVVSYREQLEPLEEAIEEVVDRTLDPDAA
ncbi:DUF2062 family protein [Halalkaliarchaeum sp. AArc-CO]|uniref:DUF2062 domain-containing protein n=1 Tax=unclassified Halalkaliarchaeum TaxID=2678344 RepID=UPI00217CF894|nr:MULTISPECIES: DUF2062 domain-containing protein [unclassified Halalkaliarchaeum]MDR5671938.1 DUF2062 domain-containing protein [Halalkaliarchaeum sp. AArc-GB]UWG51443.1 DUF2062 family protein [Halalkaliarchaeum sp. AArc-CO]